MKRGLGVLAGGMMLVAAVAAQALPLQTDRVGAGARWVAHVDVDKLKTTQCGRYLLDQLGKDEPNRKLLAFQAMFNFDPRKDVSSVTLYGSDNRPENTVTLVKGTFDTQRLETLVRAGEGYEESKYGAHVVHSWIDRKHGDRRIFASIMADGTVVLAGETSLGQALDVLDGKAPKAVAATFPGLTSDRQTAIFIASADLSGMTNVNPRAAVLSQASTAYLALTESGDQIQADIGLGAKTVEAATQIESVARGLVAMATLGQDQRPELAKLAGATTIVRTGLQVAVALRYPAADLIAGFQQMAQRAPQGGAQSGPGHAQPAALQ